MSLITIVQDACALAPVTQPTYVIGNTDETAVLCLALANRAGEEVARRPPGGWVSMIREYDFTTNAIAAQNGTVANVGNSAVISGMTGIQEVKPGTWIASGTGIPLNAAIRLTSPATTPTSVTLSVQATQTGSGSFQFGQSDYELPGDFERPIDNTFWDRTRYWQMRGPMSPQQWQVYRSSVIGRASVERRYRFRSVYAPGGLTIGGGGGGVGTGTTGAQAGFRKYISIDPIPLDNGANLVFEYVSNGWCQGTSGVTAGVPQNRWTADTDVGIDEQMEYLISLNVTWRLLRRLGLSYSEELDEFEREVTKAQAHDGASATLYLTPGFDNYLLGPWNVQEGFYPGVPG